MINPELIVKLRELKDQSGSYALNKNIPISTIDSPPFSNIRELILCDAGVHSSSELTDILIERYKIPAITLRGGLTLVDNMLNASESSQEIWIKGFLSRFAHVVILRTFDHCNQYYPDTIKYFTRRDISATYHPNQTSALIEVVSRNSKPR